jgi:5-oxopent-3-ene-1,2,5-tricarboxylate decarboxylase/2-hydroxyhepta-2,4-diene-1,7-dioate isomerase
LDESMTAPLPRSSPAIPRGTVYGVLLNDPDTLERLKPSFDAPPYKAAPKAPILYIKPRNTFAGDGAAVAVPANPGVVRIDATVGAVIGRAATQVRAEDAMKHVAGYVVVSDVTLPHDDYYRPAIAQRCRDGFCPIGPVQSPVAFDLSRSEVVVSINDAAVHRRPLSRVVRDLSRLIADVTEFMTLSEGDVLLIGPPEDAPLARPGDAVHIDVEGLGGLAHTLVTEKLS